MDRLTDIGGCRVAFATGGGMIEFGLYEGFCSQTDERTFVMVESLLRLENVNSE